MLFVPMLVHIIYVDVYIFTITAIKHALQSLMKFQLKNFFFNVAIHYIEFIGILINVHAYLHYLLHFFNCFMSHAIADIF